MKIFFRYVYKSMLEKKSRMLLIIASVALSAALLVGALTGYSTLIRLLSDQMHGVYGDFNVMISAREEASSPFFKDDVIQDEEIGESFKSITLPADYGEEASVTYIGTTEEDLRKLSDIHVISGEGALDTDNGIYISEETSNQFGLEEGESVTIDLAGESVTGTVEGICSNTGFFSRDTEKEFTVLAPIHQVRDLYKLDDSVYTSILLEVDETEQSAGEWIDGFEKRHGGEVTASLTADENAIQGQLDWLKTPLICMIGILFVMAVFIISSTFRLILTERMPVLGTFMSQGCPRQGIGRLLLLEGLFYGILGGAAGCGLGVLVAKLLADAANPLKEYGIEADLQLNPAYFAAGCGAAVLILLLSVWIPLRTLKHYSVKEIILGLLQSRKGKAKNGWIAGSLCLGVTVILLILCENGNTMLSMPALLLFFAGIMCMIPKILELVMAWIHRICPKEWTELMLAAVNIRSSALLKTTTLLICVCLTASIMMISVGNSILNAIDEAYSKMNYNISIQLESKNHDKVEEVLRDYQENGEISEVFELESFTAYLDGDAAKPFTMIGIPDNYEEYETYMRFEDKKGQLGDVLAKEGGIILSKQNAENYGVKEGDSITLEYANSEKSLQVLSIVDARMFADGNYNLISRDTAASLFQIEQGNQYYLKVSGDTEMVMDDLSEELRGMGTSIYSRQELMEIQKDEISMMTDVLNLITLLTLLIGAISCISNIFMSFLQRRKEFAVLNTVGITKRKNTGMLLLEGCLEAVCAVLLAIAASAGINVIFRYIYEFLEMDLQMRLPVEILPYLIAGSFFAVLSISLITIFKSSRLNVIEQIKYE